MTYAGLYQNARQTLSRAGVAPAAFEARCLLEVLLGMDRMKLISAGTQSPSAEDEQRFLRAVAKRAEGYPLQYLLGKWQFMGRDFLVGEGVLIPRDDTEVAVRTCCEALKSLSAPTVLELCAGSGIIAVTLQKMLPAVQITALELMEDAFEYLQRNLRLHACETIKALKADLFSAYDQFEDGSFDAIVSNPPYIAKGVLPTLQAEVHFEPQTALDGGEDGLDFYRCIAKDWTPKLRKGGSITLEIGEEQASAVMSLLKAEGIGALRVEKDIQGLDRVIFGTKTTD